MKDKWTLFYPYMLKHVTGIIHIGAHYLEEYEQYTNTFLLKDKDIIWIDADERIVEECKNINSEKIILQKILSKEKAEMDFYISNFSMCNSLYKFSEEHKVQFKDILQLTSIKVNTTTLDDVIDELINDFSKADKKIFKQRYNTLVISVNGSEYDVIKGSEKMLEFVDYVFINRYNYKIYEPTFNYKEMDQWLQTNGFREEKSMYLNNFGVEFVLYIGSDIQEEIDKKDKEFTENLQEEMSKYMDVQVWED